MAVRIDRVEREFILTAASEARIEARIQAAGRTIPCRMVSSRQDVLSLAPQAGATVRLSPRQRVSVYFDFRGQGVAFESLVLSSASEAIELGFPESMYRSLSRRWPRVPPPQGLGVDLLLPDADLKLDCPESDEWMEVELPELREGLDSRNLNLLVESFKGKASALASEGRVIMYKERGPADIAEDMVAKLGRVLYVPSTLSALPLADPYPSGRIITRDMAEDYEGPSAMAGGSRLAAYLAQRASSGVNSSIWCPVVYYRYTVGVVILSNGPERPRALDFAAVDLAWEFSRVLAWFLKRHGYFAAQGSGDAARAGSIADATPAGLLVVLPPDGPRFNLGASIRLRLSFAGKTIVCVARVARRYDEAGSRYFGLAFQDLAAPDMAELARNLYGSPEAVPAGKGG
ncbi:MAG TPA: PilZ domain-containing protein [Rectinemataceae bacterium]|nr:PilZ domain-containing protein [Rectinemataceae bacterium]